MLNRKPKKQSMRSQEKINTTVTVTSKNNLMHDIMVDFFALKWLY